MNTTAILLTQYEQYGSVGRNEFIENFIHENLDIDISMLSDFNEWLLNNHYENDYIYDDLEEMLEGFNTMDVVRATYFGNFNYSDDYYRFNGYGNVDSLTDTEIVREMSDNRDFLEWYIEENDLIDWDEADEIIEEANKLIKKGY
jgi:hypothetical protein